MKGTQHLVRRVAEDPLRLLLVLASLTIFAATAEAQAPEPEEPALVLPTYVLEVEDLKVESVEAGLPEEQDLLPPERAPPLPSSGELEVREPSIALTPPSGDAAAIGSAGAPFFVEGTVGAGTLHHLVSQLSIYRPGIEPRVKLAFSYDMTDGFGGTEAGAGYHKKTDSLEGSMQLKSGAVQVSASGAFHDTDVGLQGQPQGQPLYVSRIHRTTTVNAQAQWQASPLLRLSGSLDASGASVLLTQETPDVLTQYSLTPRLGVDLSAGPFVAGVDLVYALGVTNDGALAALHRLEPRLRLGVDLPLSLSVTGDVGWHYRVSGGAHLVPFDLTLTGTPTDPLWFRLAGGYRVTDVNRGDALFLPFSLPPASELEDERGWYAEASIRIAVLRVLLLTAGTDFSLTEGMLTYGAYDDTSALYWPGQVAATRLDASAGLRWDITPSLAARLQYRRSFLDRPRFEPSDVVSIDLGGSFLGGKIGGALTGRFEVLPDVTPQIPLPRLDLTAFVRFSANVRGAVDVTDILLPLTGAPRVGIPPYLEPGFGASVRFLVSL